MKCEDRVERIEKRRLQEYFYRLLYLPSERKSRKVERPVPGDRCWSQNRLISL